MTDIVNIWLDIDGYSFEKIITLLGCRSKLTYRRDDRMRGIIFTRLC